MSIVSSLCTHVSILEIQIMLFLLLSLLFFSFLRIFFPASHLDNIPKAPLKVWIREITEGITHRVPVQPVIFLDPNFEIVVEVRKAKKVKVKVYYFKILKIHWI